MDFPSKDVFLSIASLDDINTPATCKSALDNPGLSVRLHVVLQTDNDDLEAEVRATGAEVLRVPLSASRGACWPRAVGHTFYGGEKWFAQFDAHMECDDGWALSLAEQLNGLPRRSVLTAYAPDTLAPSYPENSVSIMEPYGFGDDGWHCRQSYRPAGISPDGKPFPARCWSAHMVFAPAMWLHELPYDSMLYFSGEEQTMSIRAWTNGWDMFHPYGSVVKHRYGRDNHNSHHDYDEDWWKLDVVSKDRVAAFYGWNRVIQEHWSDHGLVLPDKVELGIYGPGSVRTVESFEEWAGFDIENRWFIPEDEWRQRLADGLTGKPTGPAPEQIAQEATTPTDTHSEPAEDTGILGMILRARLSDVDQSAASTLFSGHEDQVRSVYESLTIEQVRAIGGIG